MRKMYTDSVGSFGRVRPDRVPREVSERVKSEIRSKMKRERMKRVWFMVFYMLAAAGIFAGIIFAVRWLSINGFP